MKTRTKKFTALALAALMTMNSAVPAELTGDVRLACEAILCLSSSARPGECSPSLARYFGITRKRLKDTISARKDFLRLCPSASADKNMETLVDAIANGAGRCSANELNRSLQYFLTNDVIAVRNSMPGYCSTWFDHPYTDLKEVRPLYVGIPDKGGFWTEPENFESAKKHYESQLRNSKRTLFQ